MDFNKLTVNSLKQTIVELRDEKYQSEKNGLAKSALDLVDILSSSINKIDVSNKYRHQDGVIGVFKKIYAHPRFGKMMLVDCQMTGKEFFAPLSEFTPVKD